jgi:hypothetical protein
MITWLNLVNDDDALVLDVGRLLRDITDKLSPHVELVRE